MHFRVKLKNSTRHFLYLRANSTLMPQNTLLLDVLNGKPVNRPPIWIMRQAGRILPEYRALRSRLSGFVELVTTPDLAAEVTVQPVDRLGVDAAIIFSDILVIPECMGLHYELIEKKGPFFPETIKGIADIEALDSGESAASRLSYVFDAINETKKRLEDRVPLIGFSGAPWTLMCYMIEGSGSKTFSKAKAVLYKEPAMAHKLLQKLTDTVIEYLKLKVKSGVDVVQVFDSWAGVLDQQTYTEFSLPYIEQIVAAINDLVPTIVFAKGAHFSLDDILNGQSNAVGLDWSIDIPQIRKFVGSDRVLQGNMDPCVLYGSKDRIAEKVKQIHSQMGQNHIFNLGHGVYPDTPLENVISFVNSVKSLEY